MCAQQGRGGARGALTVVGAALVLVAAASRLAGAQASDTTNAFADVSSRTLANGLKVWVRPFADDAIVDVMLVVAGGSSLDPRGKEELAHFVEHVVFGDRPGLTEQALNAQVESLGGKITANTSSDRTMFRVTLPAAHAAAAIRWMARLVAPREVTPSLVAQQRPPILLELGAAPRGLAGRLRAGLLDPPWLRRASPWKRDFGLETYADRDYDPFASLHRLTSADVQGFMTRYYVPSNMTLVVAGGVDRATAASVIDSAFAPLAARPVPARPRAALQGRPRSVSIWTPVRTATHAHILRGQSLSARDRVLTLFLRDFLEKRLDDRLRYASSKLVYHPSVMLAMLGDAAILTVVATSDGRAVDQVQAIVGDEIARLRRGGAADSAFLHDRRAIAGRARLAARGREALVDAVRSHFFATAPGEPMPDVVAVQASVTPDVLAALLAQRFPRAGEHTRTQRPFPVPLPLLVVAAVALAWATVARVRARLLVPVQMRTVRYVARLRVDWPVALALLLTGTAVLAVLLRLGLAAARPILESAVFPLPGALQLATYAVALALAVAAVVGLASRIPRKLLVFEDHLRLKYLAYRSLVVRPDDIVECRLAGFGDGWRLRALLRGWALTLGWRHDALLLRLRDGRTLFVRTRATAELRDAIAPLLPPTPAA